MLEFSVQTVRARLKPELEQSRLRETLRLDA
jgi:hypothetical protein